MGAREKAGSDVSGVAHALPAQKHREPCRTQKKRLNFLQKASSTASDVPGARTVGRATGAAPAVRDVIQLLIAETRV